MQQPGILLPRSNRHGLVRQLREQDTDLQLQVPVGVFRKLHGAGDLRSGSHLERVVRQLRLSEAHLQLELLLGELRLVHWAGRVCAGQLAELPGCVRQTNLLQLVRLEQLQLHEGQVRTERELLPGPAHL